MRSSSSQPRSTRLQNVAYAIALVALSACSGARHLTAEPDRVPPEQDAAAIDDPARVLGPWDVVSFDGYTPRPG